MINIFAKQAFLNTSPNTVFESKEKHYHGRGHLQRVSSMIRGDQIAERIPARFNPTDIGENDTNIFVKPMVRKGHDFDFPIGKNWIDIIDGHNLGNLLAKHPDVGIITCSQSDFDTMTTAFAGKPNKIVNIPQQHCNYDRLQRTRNKITTVGAIGTEESFSSLPSELKKGLEERGMKLVTFSKFFSREDIINFYLSIDVQIVWRPWKKRLSNPLKIVNASSFGIPTIALDEKAFHEMKGCYMPVNNLQEFFDCLELLKREKNSYKTYQECCLYTAEKYHIDIIAELYRRLEQ